MVTRVGPVIFAFSILYKILPLTFMPQRETLPLPQFLPRCALTLSNKLVVSYVLVETDNRFLYDVHHIKPRQSKQFRRDPRDSL